MCRFISVAVENAEEAKKLFTGYTVWENENKSFISEVPSNFFTLWVTDGHCSCSLYTDPYNPEEEAKKLRKRFSKPKYKNKGWSTERIEREIERVLSQRTEEGGLSNPLFSCIQKYTKTVGTCYLHVGWYNGDQNKQILDIVNRTKVPINTNSFKSKAIAENCLYEFT